MKSTSNSASLDLASLQISDIKIRKRHEKDQHSEINKHSKWIVYARVVYALFILFQVVVEGADIRRPLQYLSFTIFHYVFMLLCVDYPACQKYHAPVVSLTFASFVLINPSLFGQTQHLSLIIGFISISYLASIFVSSSWLWTILGNFLSTLIVGRYFTKYLGYNTRQIIPAFALHVLSCTCVSYYVELRQKQNYLAVQAQKGLREELADLKRQKEQFWSQDGKTHRKRSPNA